ncbi:sulfatase [Pontiella agarivorans]|uniref:Sulfatase n=1 Tax=Pontiella agarivorans TaxID=3038953 RepID=A0ABU5MS62_9BACT|nr:sulfatase [Pontiella agarivorans]MDZ8117040.1 sulfatase [Pontiella agarivorans]
MKNILLLTALIGGLTAHAEKPNILLIMVDDLNRFVGCYDGPAISPNIDKLAETGVKFGNAYSACPSCNPSRVALMTGLRPENSGVFNNTQHYRKTESAKNLTSLPEFLQQNGYHTIAAGKIFHHRGRNHNNPDPLSDPQSWNFQPGISAEKSFGHNYRARYFEENGDPKWLARTSKTVAPKDRKSLTGTWVWGPLEEDIKPTNTLDWNVAEWGAAWLNRDFSEPRVEDAPAPDEKPWLLACGIFRPHIPYICPQQYFDLYTTEENKHRLALPDLPENDFDDLPPIAKPDWFGRYVKPYPEEWSFVRHSYYACITYADEAVGIILDGLAKSEYADNTIVILMGDHGQQIGEKDNEGKAWVWRSASGTPMIIKMPNGATGTVESAVSMLDIYPTLAELIGAEPPHELDGVSLLPQLKDPTARRSEPAVITNTRGNQIGVVLDQWHYISYNDGTHELYDQHADPGEFTNLLHPANFKEKYMVVVKRLEQFIPENRK